MFSKYHTISWHLEVLLALLLYAPSTRTILPSLPAPPLLDRQFFSSPNLNLLQPSLFYYNYYYIIKNLLSFVKKASKPFSGVYI